MSFVTLCCVIWFASWNDLGDNLGPKVFSAGRINLESGLPTPDSRLRTPETELEAEAEPVPVPD